MVKEKRLHLRRSLGLSLIVSGNDSRGVSFAETAQLKDISAGGARFISTCGDKYFQGQKLSASIYLPGTPDVSGEMQTVAMVKRIEPKHERGSKGENYRFYVSLYFEKPFRLERQNSQKELKGCKIEPR